jgi:FkbM family methyltransferase
MTNSKRGNQVFDFFRNVFKFRLLESLLVSVTKGKKFGAFFTKLPPNMYSYSKGTYRTVKRAGIVLRLDLSDLVDWYSFWGFKEESKVLLMSSVSRGFTIIDAGANNGVLSLEFAKMVGENGNVVSIEPHPANIERFRFNLSLNKFVNIDLIEKGVGAKAGESFISIVDENNLGKTRIQTEKEGGLEIEIRTLDYIVNSNQLEQVDLIKIDVEGFEMEVLKGGFETIKKYQPKLFIELDDSNLREQGSSASEVMVFLKFNSYTSVHAESQELIDSDFDFTNCHFDILAIPK